MIDEKTAGVLRTGELSLRLHGGKLTELRYGGEEVVRELGLALRDRNWGTVPLRLTGSVSRDTAQGRLLHLTAENWEEDVRLVSWDIDLLLTHNGIELRVEGEYLAPWLVNRAGCYVLLAPDTTVGRLATLDHVDGSGSSVRFPALISPHQPMRDLRGLNWVSPGGQRVTLEFSGETFEMEDQRNWTDDSFKLYGTPLHLPFPVVVRPGQRIVQSVHLRITDHFYPLPALHTCAPLGEIRASDVLAVTRIDLLPGQAISPDVPQGLFHLAILLGDRPVNELRERLGEVSGWTPGYISVASVARKMLTEVELAALLPVLRARFPDARIGFGSAFYFTELNRFPPGPGIGYDFVYFGNAALVHADDAQSIVQTAAGQAATVRAARALFPDLAIWVSPLSYYPRFNPNRTDGGSPTGYAHPPFRMQHEAFTAGWVLRCLLYLAEAGCAVVECFEDRGPRGLATGDGTLNPAGRLLSRLHALGAVGIRRKSAKEEIGKTVVAVRFVDGRTATITARHTAESEPV